VGSRNPSTLVRAEGRGATGLRAAKKWRPSSSRFKVTVPRRGGTDPPREDYTVREPLLKTETYSPRLQRGPVDNQSGRDRFGTRDREWAPSSHLEPKDKWFYRYHMAWKPIQRAENIRERNKVGPKHGDGAVHSFFKPGQLQPSIKEKTLRRHSGPSSQGRGLGGTPGEGYHVLGTFGESFSCLRRPPRDSPGEV